jgi:hypothetical protein
MSLPNDSGLKIHPQRPAKVGDGSLHVLLDGGCRQTEEFGSLPVSPTESVDKHDDCALASRELGECRTEPWFDRLQILLGPNELDWFPTCHPTSSKTLPHPVHITVRIHHSTHPIPVLPGVSECLGRCLTTHFESIASA